MPSAPAFSCWSGGWSHWRGGPEAYGRFLDCATSLPGQLVLAGFGFSFFYHFCTGIRHLFWDAGYFLDLKGVYTTGYIAIAVACVLTAGVWLYAYGMLS